MNSNRSLRTLVLLSCAAVSSAVTLRAQDGEAAFFARAARTLGEHAEECRDDGYPRRARELWLEVLHQYAIDDPAARKALGYVQVGASWAVDSRFEYPKHESPDIAAARNLEKDWQRIAKELAAGHRELAASFTTAGDAARARVHHERVLRFAPGDNAAATALGHTQQGGLLGTEVDLTILARSLRMRALVDELRARQYPVENLPADASHPLLSRGKVPHIAVQTENFVIYGDFPRDVLTSAAMYAERSLAFCREVFGAAFEWDVAGRHALAFFVGKGAWEKIIRANEAEFDPQFFEFLMKNARITALGEGGARVRVAGMTSREEVEDFAVRDVAQTIAGFTSDALHEGIGHAVVGTFFGRNLIFTIGQQTEGTATEGRKPDARFELPDVTIWKDLATEIAWQHTDVPAAKLVRVSAAAFPNEARIKAWSLCDYLLRRDPALLATLDRVRQEQANETEIARAYPLLAGISLEQLDRDWRAFWTQDTPALRILRGDDAPLATASKTAPEWIAEINRVRKTMPERDNIGPLGWVADFTVACRQHAEYLKANRSARGALAEHTQEAGKTGYADHGRDFAALALVETKASKQIADNVERWLGWPGYRDALINPSLQNVGLYVDGSIVVLDVTRGRSGPAEALSYPFGRSKGVPTQIDVAELGEQFGELLAAHGRKRAKVAGYPLSQHFFGPMSMPRPDTVRAKLTAQNGQPIEGFVHIAGHDQVGNRRISAPGVISFFPLDPLPRGQKLTMVWEYVRANGEPWRSDDYDFTTR